MNVKREIYQKIVDETGLPRPTIRRIARELRNEMIRKVKILTDEETLKRIKNKKNSKINPDIFYEFIPEKIRIFFIGKSKKDLVRVKCDICKIPIGYSIQFHDETIICSECRTKFPETSKVRKRS